MVLFYDCGIGGEGGGVEVIGLEDDCVCFF